MAIAKFVAAMTKPKGKPHAFLSNHKVTATSLHTLTISLPMPSKNLENKHTMNMGVFVDGMKMVIVNSQ